MGVGDAVVGPPTANIVNDKYFLRFSNVFHDDTNKNP